MLATEGSVRKLNPAQWAFEGKWDGYRMLVEFNGGRLTLRARNGRDVTAEYPQLQSLTRTLAGHDVTLDGEAVVCDQDGVPSFAAMQNHTGADVQFWAFDILNLDGRVVTRAPYVDRRRLLVALGDACGLTVPKQVSGDGERALVIAKAANWEGVIAKRLDAPYRSGRSQAWIKEKFWRTQEVVIGGWRESVCGGIGALMLGVPSGDSLQYVGRVGTGFTQGELSTLSDVLTPMRVGQSPFDVLPRQDRQGAMFIRPEIIAEVRYSGCSDEGRLRHPSWRGLRPDKQE